MLTIFHIAILCQLPSKHDARMAISNLKREKIDEQGILFSNNFLYGTDLSTLFTSMINHGYARVKFLHSSMLPLPKGSRAAYLAPYLTTLS